MTEYATREDLGKYFDDIKALFRETDRKFKETDRKISSLGDRLGEFAQEMVRPAVVRLFQDRGYDVHVVSPNVSIQRDGEAMEIDLLVTNDNVALVVECKSRLGVEDVREHLVRLEKIKRLMPRLQESRIMGAVAGMVVLEEAARYACHQGLFVLAQSGDAVIIRNDDQFQPREW
ncbi:hypothetical protein [Desulfonatronum thioautotrophicum]|uniref:hypothetical protein n=1 Tax=Desulfonatronum thioautotrophicum TaxID=617001 RepID=UPI0005EB87D6|nr:hypothetical protein [Desulfonatronum thioautotrophicum]